MTEERERELELQWHFYTGWCFIPVLLAEYSCLV